MKPLNTSSTANSENSTQSEKYKSNRVLNGTNLNNTENLIIDKSKAWKTRSNKHQAAKNFIQIRTH